MKLRDAALSYLARREHSRVELARKLLSLGEADEIDALLDDLERENLLSDTRFAESLASARAGRHGSLRLKSELRDKGVPEAVLAGVVKEARESDYVAARAIWLKKFGRPPGDSTERARQMRFLAGRGFPLDVVRRVLGGDED